MLKTLTEIKMGKTHCEYDAHKSNGFPFAVYYSDIEKYVGQYIPMHWHREFEISIVLHGSVKFFIDSEEIILSEGDGVFVNSNIFHGMNKFGDHSEFVTAVFDSAFISGDEWQSPFMSKYIKPLIVNKSLAFCPLKKAIPWQRECLEQMKNVYAIVREEDFAFEFLLREALSKILINNIKNSRETTDSVISANENSVFEMCEYIKENYARDICVKDIAVSGNISERECYRRFKNTMLTSPMKYLESIRIKKATELLSDNDLSVTNICFSVGFSNGSYFSHKFKEIIGCSPLEYRKLCAKRD